MHIVSLVFVNNYNAKNTILDGKSTGIHCWGKKSMVLPDGGDDDVTTV